MFARHHGIFVWSQRYLTTWITSDPHAWLGQLPTVVRAQQVQLNPHVRPSPFLSMRAPRRCTLPTRKHRALPDIGSVPATKWMVLDRSLPLVSARRPASFPDHSDGK